MYLNSDIYNSLAFPSNIFFASLYPKLMNFRPVGAFQGLKLRVATAIAVALSLLCLVLPFSSAMATFLCILLQTMGFYSTYNMDVHHDVLLTCISA